MKTKIRVPCSSANLGAGFDVFGLALKASSTHPGPQKFSAFLELQIDWPVTRESTGTLNCKIECIGEGSKGLSLYADEKWATLLDRFIDIMS